MQLAFTIVRQWDDQWFTLGLMTVWSLGVGVRKSVATVEYLDHARSLIAIPYSITSARVCSDAV